MTPNFLLLEDSMMYETSKEVHTEQYIYIAWWNVQGENHKIRLFLKKTISPQKKIWIQQEPSVVTDPGDVV